MEPQSSITTFITLLLIASAVAMATKWVRLPYTLALVIVGLVISPMRLLPAVHISPDLILLIFLPALLFEAAWNLKMIHLRENLLPILTLATAGVGVSVAVIGLVLHFGIAIPWVPRCCSARLSLQRIPFRFSRSSRRSERRRG